MFDKLSSKLEQTFKVLRGKGIIAQKDIDAAMKEVRMALLEADVNFQVTKDFCQQVGQKALGEDVLKSLSPGQQIIKIVHEELIKMMGEAAVELNLKVAPPAIVMLCGLQGSGKTTTAGKLANLLRKEYKRRPLLVPADVYRPAAIDQLKKIAANLKVDVWDSKPTDNPVDIANSAVNHASTHGFDTVIIDTAGRLQIDNQLMQELSNIVEKVQPHEIILVVDAMTGQEAVNVAKGFDQVLDVDGLILTKLDGDARGGAALSMRAVTGKPIKFIGMGEKSDALEVFHPERMASRILGMGDVLTLIEKAVKEVNIEESLALQKKMKKNQFTLEDFLSQMNMVKRMGDITSLASMIPGMGKMIKDVDPEKANNEMKRIEAIILSMTPKERRNHEILNGSRRKRIALGSGTTVQEVNTLLKQFLEMRKMMTQISKMGAGGLMNMMKGFGGMR